MAKLIYAAIASLDGYTADEHGNFDWAAPDEEVHAFINDLERPIGTLLYGRRMYETMAVWETDASLAADSALLRDFAQIWQAADKIVFSKTLRSAATDRTRIERDFGPANQDIGAKRPRDRRSPPRRPGVQGRVGRRMPTVHRTHRCRGR